jgi:hypothetical protein
LGVVVARRFSESGASSFTYKGAALARPDEFYREFIRRSHRLLAAYLAIHAWRNDLDCVALGRRQIVKFWGLERRVEAERLAWLRADVAGYFPHVEILSFAKGGALAAIYLARRPFPVGTFGGRLSSVERVKALTCSGISTAEMILPSEAQMLSILTSALHGLSVFPAASGAAK